MKALPVVPAIAVSALLLSLGAGGWQSVRLAREHRQLESELGALQNPSSAVPGGDEASILKQIEETRADIERESARLAAAQAKVADLGRSLPPVKGEVLRSLGRIEELGRSASEFIEQVVAYAKTLKTPPDQQMSESDRQRMMERMVLWMENIELIGTMEDDPKEIAQLHATTIAERLKLDPTVASRVQDQIEKEFAELAAAGLVCSRRPELDGLKEWQERRAAALEEAVSRIEAFIPADQRRPWVVEQSLQLGNSFQKQVQVGPAGHGSMNFGIHLPGANP
jgi:hypothetical protein